MTGVHLKIGRVEVGVQIELLYGDGTSESITMAREFDSLTEARIGMASLFEQWAGVDGVEVGVCADGPDCTCDRVQIDNDDSPLR